MGKKDIDSIHYAECVCTLYFTDGSDVSIDTSVNATRRICACFRDNVSVQSSMRWLLEVIEYYDMIEY